MTLSETEIQEFFNRSVENQIEEDAQSSSIWLDY